MNSTLPAPKIALPLSESPRRRRRRWPWVVGICLAPFVILGLMAASYLSLGRDATTLRRHVMDATGSPWKTRVQISVGALTLGGLRAGLTFVKHADAEKARVALRAVTRASVGVYERDAAENRVTLEELLAETDRGMRQSGWSRVIGVRNNGEVVLVYVPAGMDTPESIEVCLAVVKERELVVVSTRLDTNALADVVERFRPEPFRSKLHRPREGERH